METNWLGQFEKRKEEHLQIALDPAAQSRELNDFSRCDLTHEAIPDLNFSEVKLNCNILGRLQVDAPLFVSSMTAGHPGANSVNTTLARAAQARGWLMGVGSQRRELMDPAAAKEWAQLRAEAPRALLFGNLGLAQVIQTPVGEVQRLVDSLEAQGLFIHCNPLQEVLQGEGTPNFRGAYSALEKLSKALSVPVVVKEVGCGFSKPTLSRLIGTGIAAVDVAGAGGTHWGRVEGQRNPEGSLLRQAAQTFANWGLGTLVCIKNAKDLNLPYDIWASGGVRSGLDAAKALAMGAQMVGLATPLLKAALVGEQKVLELMELFEFELKAALFCTGAKDLQQFQQARSWRWS